jgi:ankyrin repeat protein
MEGTVTDRVVKRLKNPGLLFCRAIAVAVVGAALVSAAPGRAQAPPLKVDFGRDVQPIFKERCYECHGATQQMNGFRLDRRRDALRGGTQSMIGAGDPDTVRLYLRVTGRSGLRMPPPPDTPLTGEQIAILKAWIEQGTEWPGAYSGEAPPPPLDPNAARLAQLLRAGQSQAVAKMVAAEPSMVNVKGPSGSTPLMFAALYSDVATMQLLLDKGADPNTPNAAGATPLMWAVDSVDKVRLLLAHHADPNARSEEGKTSIMAAAQRAGSSDVIKLLVKAGARPVGLQQAMRSNDPAVFKALIEGGADPKSGPALAQLRLFCPPCAGVVEGASTATPTAAAPTPATAVPPPALPALPAAPASPPAAANAFRYAATPASAAMPVASNTVRAAVERALPLLQKYDVAFVERTGCVSCHNNSVPAMTVAMARRSGYAIDEHVVAQQNARVGEYLESWRDNTLQALSLGGAQNSFSYILAGLSYSGYRPDFATDAAARFLVGMQQPDGYVVSFTPTPAVARPPIEGSRFSVTALSIRALKDYAPPALKSAYAKAVQRAAGWLAAARPDDTQDRAFQLLGLAWAGEKKSQLEQPARALLDEQRPDGGWAQLASLKSDAYATGQALVALAETGAIKPSDPRYVRGVRFLLRTQQNAGSWYVETRARPIQPPFELGFPNGRDQWISAAATAWATAALTFADKNLSVRPTD